MTVGMIAVRAEALVETEVRNRRAQTALNLTKYVAWATTFVAAITVIIWLISRQYVQWLGTALFTASVAIGTGLYPLFHRRGRAAVGLVLALGSFLLTCAAVFVLVPEISLAVLVGYMCIIILGTMLLGPQGNRWLIAVSVPLLIADVMMTRFLSLSWFTPLNKTWEMVVAPTFLPAAVVVVGLIVRRIVADQEEYFRQARLANIEIDERRAAEQEQRERLQSTVQEYVAYMAQVGQGNLTLRLDIDRFQHQADDPLTILGRQLNETTTSLQRILLQVRAAANDLTSATSEIVAATTQQAAGASEQSTAISQTTTTVDEVRAIADQSASRTRQVAGASQRTIQVSHHGQQAVQETIASMDRIKDRVGLIARNILSLSERTQQIGQIIDTVNELASQSNILALNASVEAARAGEEGKGFVVVATEVRNMAEQSRQATAQVRAILSEIQNATNATVMATEEGAKGVEEGVKLAAQAGEAIVTLSGVIDEWAASAAQVVAGGQQQAAGMGQVALAMENINRATMQNLASTRQAERAAYDLDVLARNLMEIVSQYQL